MLEKGETGEQRGEAAGVGGGLVGAGAQGKAGCGVQGGGVGGCMGADWQATDV